MTEAIFLKLAGGSLLLALIGLFILRQLRGEAGSNHTQSAHAELIRTLQAERDNANARAEVERARADTFAHQRNEAEVRVGRLEGQVRSLSEEIEFLEALVSHMSSLVEALITSSGGSVPAGLLATTQKHRAYLEAAAQRRREEQRGAGRGHRVTDPNPKELI